MRSTFSSAVNAERSSAGFAMPLSLARHPTFAKVERTGSDTAANPAPTRMPRVLPRERTERELGQPSYLAYGCTEVRPRSPRALGASALVLIAVGRVDERKHRFGKCSGLVSAKTREGETHVSDDRVRVVCNSKVDRVERLSLVSVARSS